MTDQNRPVEKHLRQAREHLRPGAEARRFYQDLVEQHIVTPAVSSPPAPSSTVNATTPPIGTTDK